MVWNDVIGQDLAKRILMAHLAADRVASAYLLVGPEGVGKRRLALEMAKALNCVGSDGRPCDACPSCTTIIRGIHPDVHTLLPSGPSQQIGIDEIRHLRSRLALKPFSASAQVAIIDGADRLTEEAANALLKSLEEPAASTRFLLTTAHLSHCLPTIVSRCQLIRCQPLPPEVVERILTATQACDPAVAPAVARLSRGSASQAVELAGRWTAYEALLERLTAEPLAAWMERPLPETRQEVLFLLDGMVGWLRDLAVAAAVPTESGESAWCAPVAYREPLRRQAGCVDLDRCVQTAFELMALRDSLEQFVSPRLVASLAREKWLEAVSSF